MGWWNIAEKCFDIWGMMKMATVKSFEPGNNSKLLPFGIFEICPGSDFIIKYDFSELDDSENCIIRIRKTCCIAFDLKRNVG